MYKAIKEFLIDADKNKITLHEAVIKEEKLSTDKSETEILKRAKKSLDAMLNSLEKGNTLDINLPIKEVIEQSQLMMKAPTFLSKDLKEAVYWAMSIVEYSNGMGIICAAPTAGSSGVYPATVFKAQQMLEKTEEDVLNAFLVGSMIGAIIGNNATLSGSEGGCQAEVGVASAMAASTITYMAGGTPSQVEQSVALSLKNLLGLVCDPVAGLVISPCIKRNAIGVMNAFLAAEMALSEVTSIIPADEVIEAMMKIGLQLPRNLKETGTGGIADTPTGRRIKKAIFGKE
ncbi:MAG: L-serine ammonia-lyase, iron-sulfur-dependent, subunit alpha [Promethearchaeota archaeon]